MFQRRSNRRVVDGAFSLVFGLWIAVHAPTIGWADSPVFHGADPRTGERLSRVTIEVTNIGGADGTPAITGFQARRYPNGSAQFGLQSFDGDLKRLEGIALSVRVDGQPYEVPFEEYDSLVIGVPGRLPPIHQLWFGPLSDPLQTRLRAAKEITFEFTNQSRGRVAYRLAEESAQKIGEVMQGEHGAPPN